MLAKYVRPTGDVLDTPGRKDADLHRDMYRRGDLHEFHGSLPPRCVKRNNTNSRLSLSLARARLAVG